MDKLLAATTIILVVISAIAFALGTEIDQRQKQQTCEETLNSSQAIYHKGNCIDYNRNKDRVLQYVRQEEPVTTSQAAIGTNLSRPVAEGILFKLEDQRFITMERDYLKPVTWSSYQIGDNPSGKNNTVR